MTDGLTILGGTVRHAIGADELETFPTPEHVHTVTFTSDELASFCPMTGQPDSASVEIVYAPQELCIESKSLKLYLWSFRDRGVFVEALAAEIATAIFTAAKPDHVIVTVTQAVRGGIVTKARAARFAPTGLTVLDDGSIA